ncbi:uncharacterized protein ARMOST_10447 [Armillaria ostoyae]|uniref:Uncharacterized protein n=1 Tax=Armillaria ostoyae TaxID=47428 RepID=A0A284REF9_ARMOS|nr:uncharacterized protein ARMOST_10447 [Armillaria ostoyae]
MLSPPGVATSSRFPPFLPYTYPYSAAPTSQSSSPPFSMSGNLSVSSFLTWDHAIAIEWAPRSPQPSPSSYWCPVPSDHLETVALDVDGHHAAVDNTLMSLDFRSNGNTKTQNQIGQLT